MDALTTLSPDCVGVILSHVNEFTLRKFRLVSRYCREMVTSAARARASGVAMRHSPVDSIVRGTFMTVVPVSQNWEIRTAANIKSYGMNEFDREVVREALSLQPQCGCVKHVGMELFISYKPA